MIISLIKMKQMFCLSLPDKVKGRYWITDADKKGKKRDLISVEALNNRWVIKSTDNVEVLDGENNKISELVLTPQSIYNLKIAGEDERVILFAEDMDAGHRSFQKVLVKEPVTFSIGRTNDNNFCYENKFVSGKHALLSYDGASWSITDLESTNGTYVNGFRVNSRSIIPGDYIYIIGLKIVIGNSFMALNNPNKLVKLVSDSIIKYRPQEIMPVKGVRKADEKNFFYPSPRFYREIQHETVEIDAPPQRQKTDEVPMSLMLGPSVTMGVISMGTGLITLNNTIVSGGNFSQAIPTLIMSSGMLLGAVLWPVLTKKHEKKIKIKNESLRQNKYFSYLNEKKDEIKKISKTQSDILNENLISLEECAARIIEKKPNLWNRGVGQGDYLTLKLGTGNVPIDADVKFPSKKFTLDDDNLQNAMYSLGTEPKILTDVPIGLSLYDNIAVGVYGKASQTACLLKSFVLQLIALYSYDELKIILISENIDGEWDFVKFIPHFWSDDKSVRFLAADLDEVKILSSYMEENIIPGLNRKNPSDEGYIPHYVIISASEQLGEKCEAFRRMLKSEKNYGYSIIYSASSFKDIPKETQLVILADGNHSVMYHRGDIKGKNIFFVPPTVDNSTMERAASVIANISLDLSAQRYTLPSMITFMEMFNVCKIEHLNSLTRWKENDPTVSLSTPIGVDAYGNRFNLDLHEKFHGPHGLVAGMTGSGKSEFIITYILSMAVNYHPDEVAFILIDYKGGGLAGAFEDKERGIKLPHLVGTITNLDGAAVKRSLISIQSELRRRQTMFNSARKISNEGTMDIYKYQKLYRDEVVSEPLPHLFIISDEFAELKVQQPEFMDQLISTARIGRSLGVHLILATQKPSGVVDDQIWSNSKFRVCLKVQEKADSQDIIKCPDAAELSQTGRFYLQVGYNELFALGQSAWCGAEYIPSDTLEKAHESSVQIIDHLGRIKTNLKINKAKSAHDNGTKQIVAIIKYLSELAAEKNIVTRQMWLDPIPSHIYIDDLEKKYFVKCEEFVLNPIIGEYDDPSNQRQGVLTVPFSSEGNCLVFGAAGNGKTTFLMGLCYSLIKNYSAEQVNIYIVDCGSESLKIFENAPQVGGVAISSDIEKVYNLFKIISHETESRRKAFADYGGSYEDYCRTSGKRLPYIVVIINNYAGFDDAFGDLAETFAALTRDCVKYGIFFAVTATAVSEVRYRVQQNFRFVCTMQLNDPTDYMTVMGKTDGLVPSKCKGRGLVRLDRVYEFQTAYCRETEDIHEYLVGYCRELKANSAVSAKVIPVLPEVVNISCVQSFTGSLNNIPVGIDKK
ncbi:MAG: type VII secretion protein EssC, partial [[Eubacterium] siraeum]|nr:type VII secretion protein EssC [[Eubacterium] siraeum]